jgi:acetoacetate decarboxylase
MKRTTAISGPDFGVDAAPYAMPPYQYRNNEMFTLKIETDPAYLRSLVPEPMVPNEDNLLVIYVGRLRVAEPKAITYGEAGIMVPVRMGDRVGTYLPVLYLDEVELLTSGREVWGFPKFPAEVSFCRDENAVEATVTNAGVDIIHMQMQLEQWGEPVPVFDREHFLLKSIPSVSGTGYDVRQINTCRVRNDQRKEICEGKADLTLRSSSNSPMGEVPIKSIVSSIYTIGDIILDRGEVIHDYLDGAD